MVGEPLGELEPCYCTPEDYGGIAPLVGFLESRKSTDVVLVVGNLIEVPDEVSLLRLAYLKKVLSRIKAFVTTGPKDLLLSPQQRSGIKPLPPSGTDATYVSSVRRGDSFFRLVVGISTKYQEELSLLGSDVRLHPFRSPPQPRSTDPSFFDILVFHGPLEEARKCAKDFHVVICPRGTEKFTVEGNIVSGIPSRFRAVVVIRLKGGGFEAKLHPLKNVPESQWVRELLRDYRKRVKELGIAFSKERRPHPGGNFVGSRLCGDCHIDAFKVWINSQHSKAMNSLIDDGRDADPECLSCHTTGYAYQTGYWEEGTPEQASVGCESCHGPGATHSDNPQKGYGKKAMETCNHCHTKLHSPHFDRDKYWERVKH